MGKERLIDKTNKPVHPLTVPTALSPFSVTDRRAGDLGFLPIGVYRGQAAFWDLDKAVNQPLVEAEKQYILGVFDGRERDYDWLRITVADGAAVGAAARDRLTVPSGQVWYVHAVTVEHTDDHATGVVDVNWRCSLWPSRQDPADDDGQAFYGTAKAAATGVALPVQPALFYTGALGTAFTATPPAATNYELQNKDVSLRLPAGTTITLTTNVTTIIDGDDVVVDLRVYGYVGKLLVA